MDSIIARYSRSGADLSNWIAGVNAYGATFDEAYTRAFATKRSSHPASKRTFDA
jgi:hypothetical protein